MALISYIKELVIWISSKKDSSGFNKGKIMFFSLFSFIYIYIYIYIIINLYAFLSKNVRKYKLNNETFRILLISVFYNIYIFVYLVEHDKWCNMALIGISTAHENIVADAFRSKKSLLVLLAHEQQATQK